MMDTATAARIAPSYQDSDRQGKLRDGLVAELAGEGLFALRVPVEYGGLGLDAVSTGVALEELVLSLGVSEDALRRLRVGWKDENRRRDEHDRPYDPVKITHIDILNPKTAGAKPPARRTPGAKTTTPPNPTAPKK